MKKKYYLSPLMDYQKVTLYHGTYDGNIKEFTLGHGRTRVDFGKGVYFTTKLQQAIDQSVRKKDKGFVYVCEFNLKNLKVLEFLDISDDFAETIHLCRIGLENLADEIVPEFEKADAIYGILVDGTGKDIECLTSKYNDGDILFDEYNNRLKTILFNSQKDQICIKTSLALKQLRICEVIKTQKGQDGSKVMVK